MPADHDLEEAPAGRSPAAEDPGRASLASVGLDIAYLLFEWLEPRDVKSLGAVCAAYREASEYCVRAPAYWHRLLRGAICHLAAATCVAHGRCPNRDPALLARHAAAYVSGAAAQFAGREAAGQWAEAHALRFLYAAVARAPAWRLAPYALEWCALRERAALGGGGPPREEVLALLYPDALARLGALARTPEHEALCSTAAGLCPGATAAGSLRSLEAQGIALLGCEDSGAFCGAVLAAAAARLRREPRPWAALGLVDFAAIDLGRGGQPRADCVSLLGDERLSALLGAFDCRASAVTPDVEFAQWLSRHQYLLQPSVVAVPNSLLGAMLARHAEPEKAGERGSWP